MKVDEWQSFCGIKTWPMCTPLTRRVYSATRFNGRSAAWATCAEEINYDVGKSPSHQQFAHPKNGVQTARYPALSLGIFGAGCFETQESARSSDRTLRAHLKVRNTEPRRDLRLETRNVGRSVKPSFTSQYQKRSGTSTLEPGERDWETSVTAENLVRRNSAPWFSVPFLRCALCNKNRQNGCN
jgi:hypothetical protein